MSESIETFGKEQEQEGELIEKVKHIMGSCRTNRVLCTDKFVFVTISKEMSFVSSKYLDNLKKLGLTIYNIEINRESGNLEMVFNRKKTRTS